MKSRIEKEIASFSCYYADYPVRTTPAGSITFYNLNMLLLYLPVITGLFFLSVAWMTLIFRLPSGVNELTRSQSLSSDTHCLYKQLIMTCSQVEVLLCVSNAAASWAYLHVECRCSSGWSKGNISVPEHICAQNNFIYRTNSVAGGGWCMFHHQSARLPFGLKPFSAILLPLSRLTRPAASGSLYDY